MGQEGQVRLAPEGTGAPVRILKVTTYIPDPTTGLPVPAVVDMQVIALADEKGNPVDLDTSRYQVESLEELRAIRRGLEILTNTELR